MSNRRRGPVLETVRNLLRGREAMAAADGPLLARFAAGRDEAAFATLVERHGPMVLGLCRRILRHQQDAEDAFQAAFLVLARKAGSIRRQGSVAGWLYRVAYRLAVGMRQGTLRRRQREREAAAMRPSEIPFEEPRFDPRPLLDEEIDRLPEKFRTPLVLCYLEGKTHAEAAREVGCPVGSVSGRLARGLALLRQRLGRRGVALPALIAGTFLTADSVPAAVPHSLAVAVTRAAVAFAAGAGGAAAPAVVLLAEKGLKTMWPGKFKTLAVLGLLALVAVSGGTGVLLLRADRSPVPAADGKERGDAGRAPRDREDRAVPVPPVDAFGDPLPPGAVARVGTVRLLHGGGAWAAVFSPDGKTLPSVGLDNTARVWEARTGKQLREFFVHPEMSNAVAFSADGKRLAAGNRKETVQVWDVTTGKVLCEVQVPATAFAVCLSPDGRTLAVADGDRKVRLHDVEAGKEIVTLDANAEEIASFAFAPDGKTLAGAGHEKVIILWDVLSGKKRLSLSTNQAVPLSLAFSPDGKMLASAAADEGIIRLWDPHTGEELRRLEGNAEGYAALAFAPDGKLLACAERNGLALWDPRTGKQVRRLGKGMFWMAFVVFSPDGKTLASADAIGKVRLWDPATGAETVPLPGGSGWFAPLVFGPDGRTVAGGEDQTVIVYDAATGKERRRLEGHRDRVVSVSVSPDGSLLASTSADGTVRLWDPANGKERAVLAKDEGPAHSIVFSPDGKTLAWAAEDGAIRLWDVSGGRLLRRIVPADPPQQRPLGLHFSPDSRILLAATRELQPGAQTEGPGAVWYWEVATGKELRRLGGKEFFPQAVALSADGRTLATGSQDGLIRVWDADLTGGTPPRLGKERYHFQAHSSGIIDLAFSPDGRTLASGGYDHVVRLWETATGKERRRLAGHRYDIHSVAFAPRPSGCPRRLVSSSGDTTGLIWDVAAPLDSKLAARRQLSGAELDRLWAELSDGDAGKAYQAVCVLEAMPGSALPSLRDRVRPARAVEARELGRLLADLDSDEFAVRERAGRDLEALGDAGEPALRRVLAGRPSPEVRRRLEPILEGWDGVFLSGERLRQERALEVLEGVGTAETRELLEALAGGTPDARLTREARLCLRRLQGRIPQRLQKLPARESAPRGWPGLRLWEAPGRHTANPRQFPFLSVSLSRTV
jgi:RNA polymerase sigma factor (sigma-70 family)